MVFWIWKKDLIIKNHRKVMLVELLLLFLLKFVMIIICFILSP